MSQHLYTNGDYLKKNPSWHCTDSPWKAKHILKMIYKNNLKPDTICEIGCGAGEILNQLYKHMPDTIDFFGYDISPQAIKMCKEKEKKRLHFYLQDFPDDESIMYDLVMTIDVIEHIENYYDFLRKIIKKGKYKLFHIPLDLSVQYILRGSPLIKKRRDVGHIHFFTKETALAVLEDTGYKIIDVLYTSSSVDLPARSVKSFLFKFPRKVLFALNRDIAVRLLGGYSLMVLTK